MHLGGDLKLFNECCTSQIIVTSFIDDEFTYLAANSVPGIEDLFPLARLKGNLLGMKPL